MSYKLFRSLFFKVNPEVMHEATVLAGKQLGKVPVLEEYLSKFFEVSSPMLETELTGILFPNPVGIAAGYDKNATAVPLLQTLGFGHIEVGTVTPRPQPGNERPRLFRLPSDEAIINRMGFNNFGIEKLVTSLAKTNCKIPIGINVGKNKITPLENAVDDYVACFKQGWSQGNYFAVNISSPNTKDLRQLQGKDYLAPLLKKLVDTRDELNKQYSCKKPVWLKIAPDLTDEELKTIAETAMEAGIDAMIATNTTIERNDIFHYNKTQQGGLSGRPLLSRSNQILKKLYKITEGKMPIIGVGGVFSGKDAYEKITLGASMVQVYTGLIYEGPALIKKINLELQAILKLNGMKHISEAVGIANN